MNTYNPHYSVNQLGFPFASISFSLCLSHTHTHTQKNSLVIQISLHILNSQSSTG